jgi:hypothetical protein
VRGALTELYNAAYAEPYNAAYAEKKAAEAELNALEVSADDIREMVHLLGGMAPVLDRADAVGVRRCAQL